MPSWKPVGYLGPSWTDASSSGFKDATLCRGSGQCTSSSVRRRQQGLGHRLWDKLQPRRRQVSTFQHLGCLKANMSQSPSGPHQGMSFQQVCADMCCANTWTVKLLQALRTLGDGATTVKRRSLWDGLEVCVRYCMGCRSSDRVPASSSQFARPVGSQITQACYPQHKYCAEVCPQKRKIVSQTGILNNTMA